VKAINSKDETAKAASKRAAFFAERKKMKSKLISILFILLILSTNSLFADDNADTGSGNTNDALDGKGFYRSSEYMYKVSVYVGNSDDSNEHGVLSRDWYRLGKKPIYLKPSSFTLPQNTIGALASKIDYLNGASLNPVNIDLYLTDNPPSIPITHGGNIEAVKSYFGDTWTLDMLINNFASQMGTTREGLIGNMTFTIEDDTKTYTPEDILPTKVDGKYQNKVPWLIIYEPVIITYLKDRTTILAFTATEYALAQKLGYFNFKSGADGQYVGGMTHSNLPNSIFLQESWFGYPITAAYPNGVYWSDDRIIQGGGWGMRMLRPNSTGVEENDTTYDHEYRVNTDVITSVRIYADEDITPDNRHESKSAYANPSKNTATITMTANGFTKSTEVVLPSGGSQLVWLKWHTPSEPGQVQVKVQVSGNRAAKMDGTARSATLTCNITDLNQNEPPNPTANDRDDSFIVSSIPQKADKTTAEWGIYSSHWIPDWVWHANWEWESDWKYVRRYGWIYTETGRYWGRTGGRWVDRGKWVDHGEWVDEGDWAFDYTNYYASLSAIMELSPDLRVPTSTEKTMKSGYGVNVDIESNVYTNAPNNHLTYVQNAIAYFPEFHYQTYWRLLDRIGYGAFKFKENKYSTYSNRTHFTPIYYPDGPYEVYTEVIDLWTPDGMLRMNISDTVNIEGSLFDDWHIAPQKGR